MKRDALVAGLKRLCAAETAPYSEITVRTALHAWLDSLSLAHELDPHGNTLVRVRRGLPRRQVGFVAHLDHPALRVTAVKGVQVTCRAQGSLPAIGLRNASVVFPQTATGRIKGEIAAVKMASTGGRVDTVVIKVPARGGVPAVDDFAVLDLPGFSLKGQHLRLRVADDLAGVAAIVAALADLAKGSAAIDAWAIFTRAEEVGFHGALSVALDGRLPRDMTVVSVECSKVVGDIELGAGPVVRLGDRAGPFDPRACALVSGAARTLAEGKTKLEFQTAMMTGGTCEATAFGVFGYATAGIALPLLSYHNQGPRGVAPEEIDLRDLEGAATLIAAVALRSGAGIEDLDLMRNDLIRASEEGRELLALPINANTGYPVGARF